MSIFSSKKVITVGTTVSRVISDELLPDSIRMGIMKGILADDDEEYGIGMYMLEEIFSSVATRAERMYEWAATDYVHGLPSGEVHSATQGRAEVQAVLDALHGESVELDYMQVGAPNNLHIGWIALLADYGYDPLTNQLGVLSAAKGVPVYLKDMVVTVPASYLDVLEPGTFEQWGTPATAGFMPQRVASTMRAHSKVAVDASATEDFLHVSYVWEQPYNTLNEDSLDIPIEGYDNDAEYFHAKYLTADGLTHYWMYQAGTGVYPTLDEVFDNPEPVLGEFFPFGYFRFDGVQENDDPDSETYRDGKKLTKYLGMKFNDVVDAIGENPDIDSVRQALLLMAVPANTTNPMERRYLYDFFDRLFAASGAQFTNPVTAAIAMGQARNQDLTRSAIVIQDARFKMALTNGGVYKKRFTGVVGNGEVNQYDSGMRISYVPNTYIPGYGDNSGLPQVMTTQVDTHWYRRQVSLSQYDEVSVVDLKVLYHIYGDYKATADDNDSILLIPLDHSITTNYLMPDREELYARSLHYVFNSMLVTKVKWYQQDWFQAFMLVVAVLLTAYAMGSDGGTIMTLAAAITAGLDAVAYLIIITILKALLIKVVLKFFIKAVGGEAAIVIGILVTAYLAYYSMQPGGVAGAPWGQQLLTLGNGLVKALGAYNQDRMDDLLGESKAFEAEAKARGEELDAARALLDTRSFFSPLFIPGEKPTEYFNRTAHSGNVGMVGIAAISNYVGVALTLPTFDKTLFSRGETNDAQPAL